MSKIAHPGGQTALFGLIRLASLTAAIPAAAIREVVPRPPKLDAFPGTRADMCGSIELRGEVIPVIDLADTLAGPIGRSATEAAATHGEPFADTRSIIVILRHDNQVFGLLADSIVGVMPLTDRELRKLSGSASTQAPALFSTAFRTESDNGIVIDPAAIAMLPGMLTAEDKRTAQDSSRQIDEPILVFSVAGLRLALAASHVDASLPSTELLPPPAYTPLWIAQREYKGVEIPVVDTLALLGHGALPAGRRSGAGIVVRTLLPEGVEGVEGVARFGLVVLLIDTVDDIGRFAERCFSPLMQDSVAGAELARGILQTSAASCLLLDAEKLAAHAGLRDLGMISNSREALKGKAEQSRADERDTRSRPEEKPFLVFSVGEQRFSTPLDAVEEIILAQEAMLPMPAGDCGMIGLFESRGHCVPLLDLTHAVGDMATRDGRYIIVTRSGHGNGLRRAGFRVDALHSVDRKVLQDVAARPDEPGRKSARPAGLPRPTIRLNDGHACTVLDLAGAAQRLLNRPGQQVVN